MSLDHRPQPCVSERHTGGRPCDPELIVDLLRDDDVRDVFALAATPTTVMEFADELGLPLSTTYRKVGKLEAAGLLASLGDDSDATQPTRYVRRISCVSVTMADRMRIECSVDGISVFCEP